MDLLDLRCLGVTTAKSSTECCSMANLSFAVLAMQKKNAVDDGAVFLFDSRAAVAWLGKGGWHVLANSSLQ